MSSYSSYELSGMTARQRVELLRRQGADLSEALSVARRIIESVRCGGDEALLECARKYDSFQGSRLGVSSAQVRAARERVPEDLLKAIRSCKSRIGAFHSRQRIEPFEYEDGVGRLGQKVVPLDRVGVYVPGGSASYASSVLMACVPARIAGVRELVVCSPAKEGRGRDAVLAAAEMCSVEEIHSVGGAQAIAAMAYGTESVRPVQKIVGPGGAVVSAAKLLVRNDCEIDLLAGPSEILVVADSLADPRAAAAEMLAQLEHDPLARAVMVSTSRKVLEAAKRELRRMVSGAARKSVLDRSSKDGAVFILAGRLSEAMRFSNEYAPEHLYIDVSSPMAAMRQVKSAGSVFLGRSSSVAFGDYCSGPNHILPTMGSASSRSSLSTYDFMKVIPYQALTPSGASRLAPTAELMASVEGLPAHAAAAALRRTVSR